MAIASIANLTDSTVAGSNTEIQYNNSGVFGASSNLTFDGTTLDVVGNAGIGIARTEGTLHVHTASAGVVTAPTTADDLVVEHSVEGGISILGGVTVDSHIVMGASNDNAGFDMQYNHTSGAMRWSIAGSDDALTATGSRWGIRETTNANQAIGLTINQLTADDDILAFKSSDIAHGVTTLAETDTYTFFDKANASGGCGITSIAGSNTYSFLLQSIASAADTTKTTISGGSIMLHAGLTNGTGIQKMSANGNLCAIGHSNDGKAAFLVDVEGDFYYDGVDGGAFDTYADAELARAFTHAVSDPAQVVRSRWDDEVRYNEEDLVKAKLIGYVSPEDKAKGIRPLVNGAQLQRLHHGAIWQLHQQLRSQEEEIKALRGELMRLQEKN